LAAIGAGVAVGIVNVLAFMLGGGAKLRTPSLPEDKVDVEPVAGFTRASEKPPVTAGTPMVAVGLEYPFAVEGLAMGGITAAAGG
jgi:hypothetical protein